MVLASISILVVEHTPSNALTSITVQGKSQLTLASLKASPRSANVSDRILSNYCLCAGTWSL